MDMMQDEKPEKTNFQRPKWLIMLFRLFAVNYKNLWTYSLKNPDMERANDFLWMNALKDFSEEIIMQSALKAIEIYEKPPHINQFLEIAIGMKRHIRLQENAKKQLDYDVKHTPPSPLLAKYMAEHPLDENEVKQLISRYSGKELSSKIIEQMMRKIGKKHAKSL
jgi:hypothetical protein